MYVFQEYENRETLIKSLTGTIAEELRVALSNKREVTLAVPGGSTPKPLFQALSLVKIEWERVVIIPTDERCVPENNNLSNARLIRYNLLKNYAKKASFLGFYIPNMTPNRMADICSKKIACKLPIDICILGMGADMHTASIFPDSDRLEDALANDDSNILIPISSPSVSEMRLTLTARVLKTCTRLHLLLTGLDKKAALLKSESKESDREAPVRAVLFREGSTIVHYSS